jgi:hypothetical protein
VPSTGLATVERDPALPARLVEQAHLDRVAFAHDGEPGAGAVEHRPDPLVVVRHP